MIDFFAKEQNLETAQKKANSKRFKCTHLQVQKTPPTNKTGDFLEVQKASPEKERDRKRKRE